MIKMFAVSVVLNLKDYSNYYCCIYMHLCNVYELINFWMYMLRIPVKAFFFWLHFRCYNIEQRIINIPHTHTHKKIRKQNEVHSLKSINLLVFFFFVLLFILLFLISQYVMNNCCFDHYKSYKILKMTILITPGNYFSPLNKKA